MSTFFQRVKAEVREEWLDIRRQILRKPLQFSVMILSTIFALGASAYRQYRILERDQVRQQNPSYRDQLDSLNNTEDSLERLLSFVHEQKLQLEEQQDLIRKLEEERAQLQPVVQADREVVDAILRLQAERERSGEWLDRFIGFFSGIAASLIASVIWARIRPNSGEKDTHE